MSGRPTKRMQALARLGKREKGSLPAMLQQAKRKADQMKAASATEAMSQLDASVAMQVGGDGDDDDEDEDEVPATGVKASVSDFVLQPPSVAVTSTETAPVAITEETAPVAITEETAPVATTEETAPVATAMQIDVDATTDVPDAASATGSGDRTRLASDVSSSNRAAKKRKVRTYQESWESQFKWLCKDELGMTCKHCEWFFVKEKKGTMPTNVQHAFTSKRPLNNWNTALDAIKSHHKAEYHVTAEREHAKFLVNSKKPAAPTSSIAAQLDMASENTKEKNLEGLISLIKCVHYNARRMHAIEELQEHVIYVAEEQGCASLQRHLAEPPTYLGTAESRQLLESVSMVTTEDLLLCIQQSPWWSLMCDESKDIAQCAECALCVRYIDVEEGEVRECFLSLLPMNNGTSEEYERVLLGAVRDLGLNPKRMIAIGLDGTASMSGKKRGLQKRLRVRMNLHAKYFWCTCHQFVLKPKGATKAVPCLDAVIAMESKLYSWFNASSVRVTDWMKFQKGVGIDKPRKVLEPHEIRWIQNARCLDNITAVYRPLVRFLRAKTADLSAKLMEPAMVKSVHLLADVEDANSSLVSTLQVWPKSIPFIVYFISFHRTAA